MRTVNEVSKLAGVSIRTLQYYDKIGLLHPTGRTESGYRLYDDTALERLQQILLFRELEFPLKEIREILNRPDFDREKALEQQITMLELKKEHLENLIAFAREIRKTGVRTMDLSVFDTKRLKEYEKQAKAAWGRTSEFQEYEKKKQSWTKDEERNVWKEMMALFAEFGRLQTMAPAEDKVQRQVRKLQTYITEHFYTCTPEILASLGKMYAENGSFAENIDAAGGEGTALFAAEAIRIYCDGQKN